MSLMCKLVGDIYAAMYTDCPTPGALFRRENETLGFTHLDVVSAMCRRWRLPELLAKPIELHHQRPADLRRTEPIHRLHRISYAIGLLQLQPDSLADPSRASLYGDGSAVTAQRLLGISESEVLTVVQKSLAEYSGTILAFSEFASALGDPDGLIERVHVGLVRAIDDGIEVSLQHEQGEAADRLTIGGQSIEMIKTDDGATAFLYDSLGQRLLAHRFTQEDISAQSLCEAFGLEVTDPTDRERLAGFIKNKAA